MSGGAEADVSHDRGRLERPETIEVRHRAYPAWALARLSAAQTTALPPAMIWAKVIERTQAAGPRAVTVALGLFLDVPTSADPRAVSLRERAARSRRSLNYVRGGIDDLATLGFLAVDRGVRGQRSTYTLTLPVEDPDCIPEGRTLGAEVHPTETHSRGSEGASASDSDAGVHPTVTQGASERDAGCVPGRRTETPETEETLQTPAPAPPRRSGRTAKAGREGDPRSEELAARLGLVLDDRPRKRAELDERLGGLLADGWTVAEVADAIASYGPPRTSVVGALHHRLGTLVGTEAPTVAARRRQEQAEARQACRCGGAGVVLDELGDAHPCADCAPAPAGSVAS